MEKNIPLVGKGLTDISPVICGWETCEPEHRYGPAMRSYYLIHYVSEGRGKISTPDGVFSVHAGEYFLIRPGEINTYVADKNDPWKYTWIGFTGNAAHSFDKAARVGTLPPAIFKEMKAVAENGFEGWETMVEEYLVTVIYRIMAEISVKKKAEVCYERQAETFIRNAYMHSVNIQDIANMLSVDRRYLSRIFKKAYGMTMQDYLVETRLSVACEFLCNGKSVSESAQLCGYSDALNFSKMFKRRFGMSPTQYAQKKGAGAK